MTCVCQSFLTPGNRESFPESAATSRITGIRIPAVEVFVSWHAGRFCRRAVVAYAFPGIRSQTHQTSIFMTRLYYFPVHSYLVSRLKQFSDAAIVSSSNNNDGACGSGSGSCGGGGGGRAGNHNSSGDDSQGGSPREGGLYRVHRHFFLFLIFLCYRMLGRRVDGRFWFSQKQDFFCILLGTLTHLTHGFHFTPATAFARVNSSHGDKEYEKGEEDKVVWEVKGGRWTRLVPDSTKDDEFAVSRQPSTTQFYGIFPQNLWLQCRNLMVRLMLPEGFPQSVTSDYLDYSTWRGVQGIASQISGVLATQSLLFAVGLGKGAIPTAAAVNWVLKDGIGHASKIFLSKYGRHFDVNPKGWRLFADLLENLAFGLEVLTPAFPHLFVMIGAIAGAGRSTATLIQAATRSCFYAGFAAQRNFAEVIAKGEAQGMVSKSIGIILAIPLANSIGSSTPLALTSFGMLTWIHMFCNLKSYQSIQLRTLNPYRASLVFSEYLLSGQVPSIKEVNSEEPLFPALAILNVNSVFKVPSASLSAEAKVAATKIEQRLQLGSKLSDVVDSKEDALALSDLYRNEGYILIERGQKFCVILKECCSPQEMLKSLFHINYVYWLERHAGVESSRAVEECKPGGRLQMSLDYVGREFEYAKRDCDIAGWITDGLIARPLPNRIQLIFSATCPAR